MCKFICQCHILSSTAQERTTKIVILVASASKLIHLISELFLCRVNLFFFWTWAKTICMNEWDFQTSCEWQTFLKSFELHALILFSTVWEPKAKAKEKTVSPALKSALHRRYLGKDKADASWGTSKPTLCLWWTSEWLENEGDTVRCI